MNTTHETEELPVCATCGCTLVDCGPMRLVEGRWVGLRHMAKVGTWTRRLVRHG